MSDAKKILVIDDEDKVLASVKKVINSKHPDYKVDLINSPSDALFAIKQEDYDLIITDLMMPGIDGLELIKKIRALDQSIRIIMITGYATMKTALLAEREGAAKYISKPFTRDELLTEMNKILEQDNGDSNN